MLSDDVQFLDLVLDDVLTLLESSVNSSDLVLDFCDLLLSVLDHLVALLDLLFEMVGELLLLSLLEVFEEKLLPLLKKSSLFVTDSSHGGKQVLDLPQVPLGLVRLLVHIGDEKLQFACPAAVSGLQLVLEVFSLVLKLIQFARELFNLSVITGFLYKCVCVIQFLELSGLQSYLLLLASDLLLQLFGLDIDFRGPFSLVSDLLGESGGHVLQLVLEHANSLLCKLCLLFEQVVSVSQLVIKALLLQILLRKLAQLLLLGLSLGLNIVPLCLFLFQEVLSFLGLETGSLTLLIVSLQVSLSLSCFGVDLSFKIIKLFILLVNSIYKALILLHVSSSSLLDGLEQLLIFSLHSLLLKLVLLD